MKLEHQHWGSIHVGLLDKSERTPLRNVIESELFETRTFAERLYRDFSRTSRRAVTARLIRKRESLPWPPVGYDGREG